MATSPPPQSSTGILRCTGCRRAFQRSELDERGEVICPVCSAALRFTVFPRLEGAFVAGGGGVLPAEGEATCTFHPELRAETVCEECGCFLSRKAAVDWAGHSYCLPCLHHLRENAGGVDFQARTVLPENRALALTWLLLPVSFVTAPIALFVLVRRRGNSVRLMKRGPWRWWIAFFSALLVTLGWLALFVLWTLLIVREFR